MIPIESVRCTNFGLPIQRCQNEERKKFYHSGGYMTCRYALSILVLDSECNEYNNNGMCIFFRVCVHDLDEI